jgi:hypothetical protein
VRPRHCCSRIGADADRDDALGITLTRSAADIGLTSGQAALLRYVADGAGGSGPPHAACRERNATAVAAISPDHRQRKVALRSAVSLADTGFGAAAQRLEIVDSIRRSGGCRTGVWKTNRSATSPLKPTADHQIRLRPLASRGRCGTPLIGLGTVSVSLLSLLECAAGDQRRARAAQRYRSTHQLSGVAPYFLKSWKHFFVGHGACRRVSHNNSRVVTIRQLFRRSTPDQDPVRC